MSIYKPIIGVTMGDPAGIGPEVSVKAFRHTHIYDICKPLIIGNKTFLEKVNHNNLRLNAVNGISEAVFEYGVIDVLEVGSLGLDDIVFGSVSAKTGEASFRYIEKAINLAAQNIIQGTVTNAISKEAINLAGHKYAGHTEIYADLTKTKKYSMMLAHENIRVVHVSTHVSLREACDLVKKDRVLETINLANNACKSLGVTNPKIAVAGLNPHSGEGGMFGNEEILEIIPAIKAAKESGIDVDGPVPPDTVFPKARGGWYDIVVAMYHDQGHIPLKFEGFVYDKEKKSWLDVAGVNITLGLPIIRTSVDHGTAVDIAYTGKASETSLVHAIEYAVQMANSKGSNMI